MTITLPRIALGTWPSSRAQRGGLARQRHHGVAALARTMLALACGVAALLAPPAGAADDVARAERLFADHCAVCHGVDRGGYIAPALNRDTTRLTASQVGARVIAGSATTLMPPHPTYDGTLSGRNRDRIARLVTTQPKSDPRWTIDDVRASLTVLVADESKLPARPSYPIADIADLMTVMVRGRHAAGDAARVVFVDGRTHETVGEVRTGWAPHLMDYHPRDPRWAYVRDDMGWVHKIDLHSLQTVRKVRVGLNGASLAVSRDGRFVAAGSYVPHTLVILDAATLEPLKLLPLRGKGADGKPVESDAGMLLATPFADVFVVALEQAGEVWIVDLGKPDFPVTAIPGVGRHLHDGFLSPDGRLAIVASYDDDVVAVVDLADKRLVQRILAGCQPHVGSGAVVVSQGRTLGIATNIGSRACTPHEVTVFDMKSLEVVKRIPVIGPTESPAAHPDARRRCAIASPPARTRPTSSSTSSAPGRMPTRSSSSTRTRWRSSAPSPCREASATRTFPSTRRAAATSMSARAAAATAAWAATTAGSRSTMRERWSWCARSRSKSPPASSRTCARVRWWWG